MLRRNLVNLLIAAVLYFNLVALLNVAQVRFPTRGGLPDPWITHKLFRMFGVFSSETDYCLAYSAMGVPERLGEAPREILPEMIDLGVYEHFPYSLGVANQRLALQSYLYDEPRLSRGYRRMADVVRRRHNAAHPERRVAQVFIYKHWWPKGTTGYWQHYDRRETALVGFD